LSYSEVADPLSKMDDYVTKIIEKATSKQERKKSHRKIKDLVDHMKPQWNRMMDAVARYEKKEKDLDDLVREAKERKVAHPTFENDEEISELLKALPDSVGDEDRGVLQKLTSKVIEEWGCRDEIIERRRKFC